MINWLRYGWPRWYLVNWTGWLSPRAESWVADFLYPDDIVITITSPVEAP